MTHSVVIHVFVGVMEPLYVILATMMMMTLYGLRHVDEPFTDALMKSLQELLKTL